MFYGDLIFHWGGLGVPNIIQPHRSSLSTLICNTCGGLGKGGGATSHQSRTHSFLRSFVFKRTREREWEHCVWTPKPENHSTLQEFSGGGSPHSVNISKVLADGKKSMDWFFTVITKTQENTKNSDMHTVLKSNRPPYIYFMCKAVSCVRAWWSGKLSAKASSFTLSKELRRSLFQWYATLVYAVKDRCPSNDNQCAYTWSPGMLLTSKHDTYT